MTSLFGASRRARSGKRRRLVAIGVALGVGATLGAPAQSQVVTPPAPAYQPITVHTHWFESNQRWAERTEVAGDMDRDGRNDIWIGIPSYDRRQNEDNNTGNQNTTTGNNDYGRVILSDGRFLVDPQGNKDRAKPIADIQPPEPQLGKQFGFWIENPGDLNGDGYSDLAVGTDAQDVPWDPTNNSQVCNTQPEICNQNQGKVWVFDGKTEKKLYELNNPRPQGTPRHRARFGSRIGTLGDVTGNGVNEIIVGASGNDNPESWSPANGGDGCSDDGVIEPGCRSAEGQAFVFEGATGALLRELKLPDADENPPTTCTGACGSLGLAVQSPGDVDGDGKPDVLVDAGTYNFAGNVNQGRMYVYSGAAIANHTEPILGDVIRRIDDPVPQPNAIFGFQDVTHKDPGDVNQDGRADIYGNGFQQHGPTGVLEAGRAWVFNGGAGTPEATPVLYEFQNPHDSQKYGAQFGWSMTRDRNRNPQPTTVDDTDPLTNPVYIGNAPHHAPANPDQTGNTNIFNAATGTHLQNLPLPPPWNLERTGAGGGGQVGLGPNLGWTVSSPGDLNGDTFRDFVAGAPFTDVCDSFNPNTALNPNQGVLIVFRSSPSGNTDPISTDPNGKVITNACPRDDSP